MSITAHIITLSNHRQAWDLNLALFSLADGDPTLFFDFVGFLFDRQEQFYNASFKHKTHEDLRQLTADFAHQHSGVEKTKLIARMDEHDIYIDARTPIRFAATRSVWATPTFFINNADDVPVSFDSSVQEWIDVIDPLLN